MKKFIKYFLLWLFLVFILLECTLRIFGLASKTMPTEDIDGNYVFEAGASGILARGGLGEAKNYYQINKQGYNSIIEYDHLEESHLNIALIGDSYIEGFHTDVRLSIGRQLEEMLGGDVTVHEYGKSGANIVDFSLVYNDMVEPMGYDFIFILATDKDLFEKKADYIGRVDRIPKKGIARKLYDNIHILRYLNMNQGLGAHFDDLISKGPESLERIHNSKATESSPTKEQYLKKINKDALRQLSSNVVFLHEYDKLSQYFMDTFDFKFKKVIHIKKPKDLGFDRHWNVNGRYNCAKAMAEVIQESRNNKYQ